ncbi:MAG: sensor histidine kinase, partial [Actinomycetes bacterium]
TEAIIDGVSEPTPERLVSLHDEVLRLERLTDDLATLSAADAAALSLHRAPVDLVGLARRSVDALAPVLDDAGLSARVDADCPVVVGGDDTRLVQVVTNLVNNAAKFTPSGGSVRLTVLRVDDDAVLTVADTGPGIPADELPHLFERFWRGSAARVHRGTGIGLSVVHALVVAHGGTVTADSPPSGGARFTVRLPALDEST